MFLKHSNEIGCVFTLSFGTVRIGLRVVEITHRPLRRIACLHELYLFVREVLFQLRQSSIKVGKYTFVIWIIRGVYDVVVDLILLDALEESYIERSIIGALLRMDDDFRLGTS